MPCTKELLISQVHAECMLITAVQHVVNRKLLLIKCSVAKSAFYSSNLPDKMESIALSSLF